MVYVCKCYLHSQRPNAVMEREMAYTADVNQWRGPDAEAYRPRMHIHPGMVVGTILGFLFWWPVGLAFLFFTLRSTTMGCWSSDRFVNKMQRMPDKMERKPAPQE